jgi:hypothetical protein
MDYLRSCYSTMMVMDGSGVEHPVQWYFQPVGSPVFPGTHFASLNWTRPDERGPAGSLGEVDGAARPYAKGSVPVGTDLSFTPLGEIDWYSTGAPLGAPAFGPLDWEGNRTADSGLSPGLFPTTVGTAARWYFPGGTSSNTFMPFAGDAVPGWSEEILLSSIDFGTISWRSGLLPSTDRCRDAILFVSDSSTPAPVPLKCLDSAGGVSHWQLASAAGLWPAGTYTTVLA